jgi:cellulose synthase/poly-beta-1,6-N-acetylglucosamine synthase-like glycosyltransferase
LHVFWIVVTGGVALAWIVSAIDIAIGVRKIPWLRDAAPLEDSKCPAVSILFAGRDEAEKMPEAIGTMLALDYPRYEVIAVDDRSEDATGTILADAAKRDARLKPVRVDSLPPAGWASRTRWNRPTSGRRANGWSSPMRTCISSPMRCGGYSA